MPAVTPGLARRSQRFRNVELRRTAPTAPTVTAPSSQAPPKPRAFGSGAFASPVPSMLELSAATRAVAAESQLRPAIAVLQREACWLTRSQKATVMTFDGARRTVWSLDGLVSSGEIREIVARVAVRGQREVFDHALIEPIGSAPSRAVLALWRTQAARFEPDDIALVAALVGGVAATINRLIGA
jgi:hypothetical protein